MNPRLHSEVKSIAYKRGMTLQSYIVSILEMSLILERKDSRIWMCEDCGHWELQGTQMAMLKDCGKCGKKETATFLCEGV
jgi:ribosomal protein L37AE/L43A